MVSMLVGERDPAYPSDIQADGACPALHLAGAETGIDQERHAIGLYRAAVASRSGAEHIERDHRLFR
jgi:hypothetical protein